MYKQPYRRRRKRRRGGLLRPLTMLIFAAAVGYIAYALITHPAWLTGSPQSAPVFAEAAENAGAAETPNTGSTSEAGAAEAGASQTNDTEAGASQTNDAEAGASQTNDTEAGNPYAYFSYYIADKLSEYEAFHAEDTSLSAEDVVWMVNARLNRPFYDDIEIITQAEPLLITPNRKLPDDYAPAVLEAIDSHGRLATPETISAFRRMQEGALADGFKLVVQSAYRTIEYQRGLYERAGADGAVARPGHSEHHTGRALDLWGPGGLLDEQAPSDTGRWVAAHANDYGFIVRYTEENKHITGYIAEPWHITYVGEKIASEMRNGAYGSLEEYAAKTLTDTYF